MRKGRIGLGVETELLLEIKEAAEAVREAGAAKAVMVVTEKADEAEKEDAAKVVMVEIVKVVIAVIEKGVEAGKVDLAEGIVKANTTGIVKVVGATKAVILVAKKGAEVEREAGAVKAVILVIEKEAVEKIVKVETAEVVGTGANPEENAALTETAQKNIPAETMTEEVQGKNQEASLELVLTAPDS